MEINPININKVNKLTNFFVIIKATVFKEINVRRRYLPNFIGQFVVIVCRILFFLLLSSFMNFEGNSSLSDMRLFVFFYCAIILLVFSDIALHGPTSTVSADLYNGTLEYLYMTPISIFVYFIGTVITNFLVNSFIFIPLFIFLVIFINLSLVNTLFVILVCLVFIISLAALGALMSVLVLYWKQITSVLSIILILFEILSGAYFPVEYLPVSLKYIAYLLPYTWGYDLMRYFCYDGKWNTIEPLWFEFTMLIGFMFIYTVLAVVLLWLIERKIKNRGLNII